MEPGVGRRDVRFTNVSIDKQAGQVALDLSLESDHDKLMRVIVDVFNDKVRIIDGSWDHLMERYIDYAKSHGYKRASLTPEGLTDGLKSWARYKLEN